LNTSGYCAAAKQAALVDPRAEVGRDRDIRRSGDDAVGEVAAGFGEVEQDAAERGLGRLLFARRRGERRDATVPNDRRALFAGDSSAIEQMPRRRAALSPTPSSGSHSWPSRDAHDVAQRRHLGGVHQPA
jgi:hypothetical protein